MIREATGADITAIIALGQELGQQTRFMASINPHKARKNLAFFIHSKRCLVLVAEHQGVVVGFIVGGIEDLWYSDEQVVTDVAFYVRPAYRAYAVALLKRLRNWGQGFAKVSEMVLGISTGMASAPRTGQMYECLGLQRVGGLYTQQFKGERNE